MSDKFPFNQFLKKSGPQQNREEKELLSELFDKRALVTEPSVEIDTQKLTKELLQLLKESISEQRYLGFFKDHLTVSSVHNQKVKMGVTTPFIANTISNQYKKLIEDALFQLLNFEVQIELEVQGATGKSLSPNEDSILKAISITNSDNPLLTPRSDLKTPSHFTFRLDQNIDVISPLTEIVEQSKNIFPSVDTKKRFSNFVVGPSNAMSFKAIEAIAKRPGKKGKYPCLYLYGESGIGKTHLATACLLTIKDLYPEYRMAYTTITDLTKEMYQASATQGYEELFNKYSKNIDILIIEEIQELKGKEKTQDFFYQLFNDAYQNGKQIIMTSLTDVNKLEGIRENILSRLKWGLVIQMQKPDQETRYGILQKKAEELDLFLSDEILHLISSSFNRDARELEGILMKLSAYSELMGTELDKELVKEQLRITERDNSLPLPLFLEKVAELFEVTVEDLKSKKRVQNITTARHVAIYLIHKHYQMTSVETGKLFNRDHSTVLHAIEKIESGLNKKENQQLNKKIYELDLIF